MRRALPLLLAVVSAGAGVVVWWCGRGHGRGEGAGRWFGQSTAADAAMERAEEEFGVAFGRLPEGDVTDWARRIAAAQAVDFPVLLEELKEEEIDGEAARETIGRLLTARWADFDPMAAWDSCETEECRGLVLAIWAQRDLDGALAALAAREHGDRVVGEALDTLLNVDPEAAWRLVSRARLGLDRFVDPRWKRVILARAGRRGLGGAGL